MAHLITCKKERNPRKINIPIADTIAPGLTFLIDELQKLHKCQQILDHLMIGAIEQFTQANKTVFNFNICIDVYKQEVRHKLTSSQSAIMSLCARSMINALQKCNNTDDIHSLRNWFDTKKTQIIAINFWIPSMQLIQEFAMKAAARLFSGNRERDLRESFCSYLNVLILKSLFESQTKPSNTRGMWFVHPMSYRVFLARYNHHLHVTLQQHPTKDEEMRREYVNCIKTKNDALRERFYGVTNKHSFSIRCTLHPRRSAAGTHTSTLNGTNHANTIWHQSDSRTDIKFCFENDAVMIAYTVSF
eukprot:256621_1